MTAVVTNSAPARPANRIARVRLMLGRLARRVRTACAGAKPARPPAPARQPAPQPDQQTLEDDCIAAFCEGLTIGEIFASFCAMLNIDETSPLWPANLIACTSLPGQLPAAAPPAPPAKAHPTLTPAPIPAPSLVTSPVTSPAPIAVPVPRAPPSAAPARAPHPAPAAPRAAAPATLASRTPPRPKPAPAQNRVFPPSSKHALFVTI